MYISVLATILDKFWVNCEPQFNCPTRLKPESILNNMSQSTCAIDDQLETEGYGVIKNVLSQEECIHFKRILQDAHQKYSASHFKPTDTSTHRLDDKSNEDIVFNLHNKHIELARLVDHDRVYPHVANMLQRGSYNHSEPFILALTSARNPKFGAPKQQLHMDSRYPGAPFPLALQVFFCLDPFNTETGSTRVVPRSHKVGEYPENGVTYDTEITIEANQGDVVIWDGSLWHGSSEKRTNTDRWGLIYTFARWFIKPSFDFNRNTPINIYNQLSDRQKDLLGFRCNPPKDEFTRLSTRSSEFELPSPYQLPNA
jgi:ectoine hydroxylase-related dioxygenase (phytanoyl-CoA dioxygenase family)